MNTSVFSLAPNHKTYSMTNSLLTRVSIGAGLHIVGHEKFWENLATFLEFTWDTNFLSTLRSRDTKKKKASIFQRIKGGKFRRSQTKYKKKATRTRLNLMGIRRAYFISLALQLLWRKNTEDCTVKPHRNTCRLITMQLLPISILNKTWS